MHKAIPTLLRGKKGVRVVEDREEDRTRLELDWEEEAKEPCAAEYTGQRALSAMLKGESTLVRDGV
jgi:hypothetical protein